MQRQHYFDNLKAGLIFLVVLGHFFELVTSRIVDMTYVYIYLFHMPLFVFVSGYFAKYDARRLLFGLVPLYAVFQVLYITFLGTGFGHTWLHMQFTSPHWIMWYLFALIVWTLFVPILEFCCKNRLTACLTVVFSFALGLLAGFDDTVGYFLSLSRILYFFPFFVLGYVLKKFMVVFPGLLARWYVRGLFGLLSLGIAALVYLYFARLDLRWFWGAYSYGALSYTGYGFMTRGFVYMFTIVLSVFVLSVTPRGKWFFSYIGKRTLPVFLLHGFVVLLVREVNLLYLIPGGFVVVGAVFVFSLCLVLVFSSGFFSFSTWYGILKPGRK